MAIEVKRYVLLVDKQDGKATKLGPLLKELGLRLLPVNYVTQAVDIMAKQPGLCMVVIGSEVGQHTSRALATAVRTLFPQMPVIWVGEKLPPPELALGPHVTLAPTFEVEPQRTTLTRLLKDGYYPADLVETLLNSATTVLKDSFKVSVAKHEAFLRFSKDLLADISAIVQLSGSGISGRIIVGGTADWFQSLLGTDSRRQPDAEADVAGEMCNRVLGRFKELFERQGAALSQTTPVLLLGRGLTLREPDGVSVAVRCSLNAQDTSAMFVDLSLKGFQTDIARRGGTPTTILEPGDVNFL